MIKKIVRTILGILLVYSAVAFAIKAGIGVLPVDAAITSIATLIGMKVGTFSMLFHGSFFLGQIAMERRDFKKTEFLQLLYITLGGSVLNFFLYTVLRDVSFSFYPLRLIVCVLAFAVSSFGCTMVLETHLMRTPMEGCIQMIAERIGTTMGKLRQKIDVVLVIISVLISLVFGVEWTLREGTIIAALIFGPMFDFWKKYVFSREK
ncbi:MAG: hypothetical protein E7321_02970 [Clostridiales bacterium]|nr:hypothetical protein [Clostridiales bacterium]